MCSSVLNAEERETSPTDRLQNRSATKRLADLRGMSLEAATPTVTTSEFLSPRLDKKLFSDSSAEAEPVFQPTFSARANRAGKISPVGASQSQLVTKLPRVARHAEMIDPDMPEDSPTPKAALAPILPRFRKITEIEPFSNYAPDGGDPCEFLCPRPGNCKPGVEYKQCPEELELPETNVARNLVPMHEYWMASNLYNHPLYFEDGPLERYGHNHGELLQPFVSVGHFGLQLIGLPYQMWLDPPCSCQYSLGWYRPGECAPKKCYKIPLISCPRDCR